MCDIFAFVFFFFNDTATTEIYTLSLHDALPISNALFGSLQRITSQQLGIDPILMCAANSAGGSGRCRSEEHTSELQSQSNLVCRLLLEKKKKPESPPVRQGPYAGTQAVSNHQFF